MFSLKELDRERVDVGHRRGGRSLKLWRADRFRPGQREIMLHRPSLSTIVVHHDAEGGLHLGSLLRRAICELHRGLRTSRGERDHQALDEEPICLPRSCPGCAAARLKTAVPGHHPCLHLHLDRSAVGRSLSRLPDYSVSAKPDQRRSSYRAARQRRYYMAHA
jgi:hypothetical protein